MVQFYDKEADGVNYETDEAEKEAENHSLGVFSRKEVHKRAATLLGKNSRNDINIGNGCKRSRLISHINFTAKFRLFKL